MSLVVLGGTANVPLARAVANRLGTSLGRCTLELFPDGEQRVELHDSVRGRDTYILQPTPPPVAQHLMELLLLADACRRAGASRLTAIVSYLGYARQDRRAHGREPISARLVGDLIEATGIERLLVVDLHSPAVEGMFSIPVEHLSAVPMLAAALRLLIPEQSIVVAPDVGAAKLAERYGDLLELPVAAIHKLRISGTEVTVRRIAGDVAGRAPLIVDDMITTGATVEAAAQALVRAGARPEISVAASHGLFVERARERLDHVGIRRLVVSDSVPIGDPPRIPCDILSLAPLLAETIDRLHREESLADLIVHG